MEGHSNIVCGVYMITIAISTFFGWVYDAIRIYFFRWVIDSATLQSVDLVFSIVLKGGSILSVTLIIILNWYKLKANFKEKISKIKPKNKK